MTKKDYVAIAKIIKETKDRSAPHEQRVISEIQGKLSWFFMETNSKFRAATFETACERTNDETTIVV